VGRALRGGERFAPGDRVGIPWLGWTCGECRYCRSGRENLCDRAVFTGYARDGGYAELAVADERFCVPIPDGYEDADAAPVVCAGIHMSDIPSFPYSLLWEERVVRSVANLTRADAEDFMALAPLVPVRTEVETFPLAEANRALDRLRRGEVRGAAVLVVDP